MPNMTLLTDLYQLTMVGGYYLLGKKDQKANFDLFFRKIPENGGFCVAAGLEQVIRYIQNIHLEPEEIEYLRRLELFTEEVIEYFQQLRFTGDLYAVPEGTLVFPQEPVIRVTAPLPEAQLIETALLNIVNFQTLVATKTARLVNSAAGDPVVEFGVRRAQGPDGGMSAARAAFIGGAAATSNVMAGKVFGIPIRGTMAHSWVESFPSEIDSFRAFARVYPQNCILLVDTYDTLRSGVPNAIQVGRELKASGKGNLLGIRLDSGDLTFLSREARRLLDDAGFDRARIMASSDLDEWLIESIKKQGAEIDLWGVGTRLVTSYSCPALGGVYKLSAVFEGGNMQPKLKVSDDPDKTTNPGVKKVIRFYDEKNFMRGDLIIFEDENLPSGKPIRAFHPILPHVTKTYPENFRREEILVPVFKAGRLVYSPPNLPQTQKKTLDNLTNLRPEHKRLQNPHLYHVSLGENLFAKKEELIKAAVQ
jgi:nicotinate phosphoribosyltransferase